MNGTTLDPHFALDLIVIAFSALSAWNNLRMRDEIKSLKLWIVQNFHAKPNANFLAEEP